MRTEHTLTSLVIEVRVCGGLVVGIVNETISTKHAAQQTAANISLYTGIYRSWGVVVLGIFYEVIFTEHMGQWTASDWQQVFSPFWVGDENNL